MVGLIEQLEQLEQWQFFFYLFTKVNLNESALLIAFGYQMIEERTLTEVS